MKDSPEHLVPIAMPWVHGSLFYNGVIFTTRDSGINSITDLKGKNMAFVDPTSTSGYLYPCLYMQAHGINPDKDLANKYFAETGVVPAVLNHSADAGAIYEDGLALATKGNPADFNKLKVLARFGHIVNGMLVVRGNLDPRLIAQFRQAVVGINTDPAGKPAMAELETTEWQPADDSLFDPVRKAANARGITIQMLEKK
jgi:phosphonate transport system substrate-binding protein